MYDISVSSFFVGTTLRLGELDVRTTVTLFQLSIYAKFEKRQIYLSVKSSRYMVSLKSSRYICRFSNIATSNKEDAN